MTDIVPIYNVNHDIAGTGYIVEGEEDRGIRVRQMFTHDRIQLIKAEVDLRSKLYGITKEEAIMRTVRRM